MRTLMYASVMLAWSATLSAQILDVRELNTEQIGRLDRARTVVLLTAGILEEHGPFLPSYSDGYQSEFIAIRVADAIAADLDGRFFASRTFRSAHSRPTMSAESMCFQGAILSAWRRYVRSSWTWRLISARPGSSGSLS